MSEKPEGKGIENQKMMTLIEHLLELKDHVLRVAIALVICGAASFAFASKIFDWILLPLNNAVIAYNTRYGAASEIINTDPTMMIGLFMKISLFSGAIIAMPFIVYQILHYVLPGLTRSERRALIVIIPSATLFFIGGAAFAYFLMVPTAIPFLLGFAWTLQFGGGIVEQKWEVSKYLPFILNLVFWVGVSFETPLIMAFIARLGVVTHKQFLAVWKFAVVGIGVLAALITPTPDPFNMGIVMAPLLILYFFGVFLARVVEPKNKPDAEASSA
ncbi:MAG: twin-arginine translocase subunit TatC [Anaerolineae bacterium]|nr:twin-arginine translocase subunit TatC [Anaerolineae bacterium]